MPTRLLLAMAAAVRQAGLTEVSEVRVAILETNGRINVIAMPPGAP